MASHVELPEVWVQTNSPLARLRYGIPFIDSFCVADNREVTVSFRNQTDFAGIKDVIVEASDGSWLDIVGQGPISLPKAGWYGFAPRDWSVIARNPPEDQPTATLRYEERYRVDSLNIGGCEIGDFESTSSTGLIARPNKDLGELRGHVYLDGGADDNLSVEINGTIVRTIPYGPSWILDLTQRLRDGANQVRVIGIDNNAGHCWAVAYRIGDDTGFKFWDHIAHTYCSTKLPHQIKRIYTKTFTFSFRRTP